MKHQMKSDMNLKIPGSNTSKGVSCLDLESNTRKIHLLTKKQSDIVNVNPINLTLTQHRITSSKLRKIGIDYASRIHEDINDSYR
ncbi:3220_t:CDS:2 [Funneliformis geosporum]|uniref:8510_t:CDS:1 n=1 Tax=Funneliformis geosporum TaxID=1117311 RepID=A0A9W4T4B2_9GLOM|nr:8510_t:CDS:2 [Funneliformis geosporum]CAI2193621.1 3220_t:CDS:2 [Funneliformis geosporum]